MREKWLRSTTLFLFFLILSKMTDAQGLSNDSLKNYPDLTYAVHLYYTSAGENAHLYNGYEYMTPDRRIKGDPYFLTEILMPANISYDGTHYQNIPAIYDMERDLVVINRLNQNFKISLISEKLDSFSLQNHTFIRVDRDSVHGVELMTGFYDKLYGGKSTVLVKRRKVVLDIPEYNSFRVEYREQDVYYVKFAGHYVVVNNKSSVLKLFRTKKSEIKSFLRKNKLKFKSDFGKTLVAASAYYDQLTS